MKTEYFTEVDLDQTSFYSTAKRMYKVLLEIKAEYEEKENDLTKRASWEDDNTIKILKKQASAQIEILEMVYRDSQSI